MRNRKCSGTMSAADKLLVLSHPDCLAHQPVAGHPESPARLQTVLQALQALPELSWRQAPLASRAQLLRAHPADYLAALEQYQAAVAEQPIALDPDTWLGPASLAAARRAAGAVCAGIEQVMQTSVRRVFCAVRPPGHHAERARAMGFCFYSTVAVGALYAVDQYALQRVAVVDFDVHQGNGSEDVLGGHANIHYFASHQVPLYPFADQQVKSRPDNLTYRGLPAGCDSATFRRLWSEQLLPRLDNYQPELLLVSAGFDAHQADPLAQCNLHTDDFGWLTEKLVRIAVRHARGRIVSSLEGGYDLAALAASVVSHAQALQGIHYA